ncbi:MAG: DUF1343 domain-containing protein [Bacteroidales bacterium]|nr:DUF1343 domain-containing protein [Bacteroidales bacterium]
MKKIFLLLVAMLVWQFVSAQLVKGDERLEEYLPMLENKSVGVVCNHTSLINSVHLADTLLSNGVNITVLFTPEHGLKGTQEAGKLINGISYYKDSIKIISLYGKNKKPTEEQMNELDIVLFDLQDVGCRFYTYISTLEYVMEACIETGKKLIVLDRPNPNNFVAGPVLQNDCKSFVGMQNIPICYGLTIGEYALMLLDVGLEASDKGIDTLNKKNILTVIEMQNYKRDSIYALDVFPSPNLQSMQAIKNYPTLCLFEGTPISIGRGTDSPFEIVGFPNYNLKTSNQKIKTISFIPKSIKGVAENPPFKDKKCRGEVITIRSDEIELEYIIKMYKAYPKKEGFFTRMFDLLTGDKMIKEQIIAGKSAEEIKKSWENDLNAYKEVRNRYLIY